MQARHEQNMGRDLEEVKFPRARHGGVSSRAQGAPAAPLTIGSTSGHSDDVAAKSAAHARRRRADLAAVRPLLRLVAKSAACCGLGLTRATPADQSKPIGAELRRGAGGGRLAGLASCSSPWCCPCCAPLLAASRGLSLSPQVQALAAAGWTSWLVTLTTSHDRDDPADFALKAIRAGWTAATGGRHWKEVKAFGKPEYVRGFDLTWSPANGYHGHMHLAIYMPPQWSVESAREALEGLIGRFLSAMASRGYHSERQAQDLQLVSDASVAARYAATPAACYEAAAMGLKRSRGEGAGLSPFELIERYRAGDEWAGAVFREYARGTKGVRQVCVSRGLHLADDDAAKAAAEEAEKAAPDVVAVLSPRALIQIDGDRRSDLIDAAARSAEEARALLEAWYGPPTEIRGFPPTRWWWALSAPPPRRLALPPEDCGDE